MDIFSFATFISLQTKFRSCLLFVVILLFTSKIAAYKILALFPHIAKSHFVMGEALMKGLAARGHQVFVVNHFLKIPLCPTTPTSA
jgi:hypothetical protein